MLKILADPIMKHHMVSGGRQPPHIMWSASIFSIGLYSQLWPILYFQLRTHIVFSALAPYCIVFQSRLGPHTHVSSASLYVWCLDCLIGLSALDSTGTSLSCSCRYLHLGAPSLGSARSILPDRPCPHFVAICGTGRL